MSKITELPAITDLPENIDNCFVLSNDSTKRNIPIKTVFDAVLDKAKESGLTVELKSDRIAFISK